MTGLRAPSGFDIDAALLPADFEPERYVVEAKLTISITVKDR